MGISSRTICVHLTGRRIKLTMNINRHACLTPAAAPSVFHIPHSTSVFHIYQVMYGGRVIDDFDRRVVSTYMDEYMGDFLFDKFQPFHFYRDSSVSVG